MGSIRPYPHLLPALVLLAGCTHWRPVALSDATMPLSARYTLTGPVVVEGCQGRLLGFPLDPPVTLAGLLEQAHEHADALVRVSVDRRQMHLGIASVTCVRLQGAGVRFIVAPPRARRP